MRFANVVGPPRLDGARTPHVLPGAVLLLLAMEEASKLDAEDGPHELPTDRLPNGFVIPVEVPRQPDKPIDMIAIADTKQKACKRLIVFLTSSGGLIFVSAAF